MKKICTFTELSLLILLLLFCSRTSKGQDTILYYGVIPQKLILESIEFYPDSTFKWTSEFDLSWSEYGSYSIEYKKIVLKYYIVANTPNTMTIKDSIAEIKNPYKKEYYILKNEKLYRLDKKGKKQKRIKDTAIRTNWSWLYLHRHRFEFQRVN